MSKMKELKDLQMSDPEMMEDQMIQEVSRVYALLALHENWLETLFVEYFKAMDNPLKKAQGYFDQQSKLPQWAENLDQMPHPMGDYLKQHLLHSTDSFQQKVIAGLMMNAANDT